MSASIVEEDVLSEAGLLNKQQGDAPLYIQYVARVSFACRRK